MAGSSSDSLRSAVVIPGEVAAAMSWHTVQAAPEEACGLVAGPGQRVAFFYPLTNVDHSAVRYTIDPDGHFGALQHAEASGWQLIGVFHSHPVGPAVPSETDVAGALEPDWFHLIMGDDGEMRAWRVVSGNPVEIDVIILDPRHESA